MATDLLDKIEDRLSWYRSVLSNEKPAKYLLCKLIGIEKDPATMTDAQLWIEHTTLRTRFADLWREVKDSNYSGTNQQSEPFSLLDVKLELLNRILRRCVLCEWRCKVNRAKGKKGACHLDKETRVATFFRHFGEEPPLVGRKGSGTIFFTGCTFRCVFCQNWDISQVPTAGEPVSSATLASIIRSLREEGAANINLVGGEPTPHLHTILEALTIANVNVPILWNSNMYATCEAMEILADVVDIWLPDFKWGNDECAVKYSRVTRYFEVVSRNHRIAHETADMIIRHLVVPGHVECCTKRILEWIAESCSRAIVNVMGQYRPEYLVGNSPQDYPEIARCLTRAELEEAEDYARKLDLVCLT
jgi:putative pyruvate formate lyase activating enzyme